MQRAASFCFSLMQHSNNFDFVQNQHLIEKCFFLRCSDDTFSATDETIFRIQRRLPETCPP